MRETPFSPHDDSPLRVPPSDAILDTVSNKTIKRMASWTRRATFIALLAWSSVLYGVMADEPLAIAPFPIGLLALWILWMEHFRPIQ